MKIEILLKQIRLEKQEREPKISTLILIAKALKVDVNNLYRVEN